MKTRCVFLAPLVALLVPLAAVAQQAPSGTRPHLESRSSAPTPTPTAIPKPPPPPVPLTIPAGSPLYIALEKPVPVKQAGVAIRGRLVRPVYVFNRQVLPAGTQVAGQMSWVQKISAPSRALALANGNFTPFRKVRVAFTGLVLPGGRKIALQTKVSPGIPHAMTLIAGAGKKAKPQSRLHREAAGRITEARQSISTSVHQTIHEVRAPGKWQRAKTMLAASLPFHRETLPAGMQFTAVLQQPLPLGSEQLAPQELARLGSGIPPGSIVHAWLTTPLSSATSHFGSPVEAVISQPLYSAKGHHLLLPEGALLQGRVTQAVPAKRFARNGKLRILFRQIQLPSGTRQQVEANLYSVVTRSGAHVQLDSEGGAHVATSKTRFIMPTIDVMLAMSSTDGLEAHQHDPLDAGLHRGGDFAGGAVRGGAGLGLLGLVLGVAAHSRAVSAGFAFYGAGRSVYSHFIAPGANIVFARDTPMEIRFGSVGGKPLKLPPAAPASKASEGGVRSR